MSEPHYDTYQSLPESERFCTCCGRDLNGHAIRWLELDQRTNTYHDDGGVPFEYSQGGFPFGLKCAKKEIAKHKALLSELIEPPTKAAG